MNCFHILKAIHVRHGEPYHHAPEMFEDSAKLEEKIVELKEWFQRMNYAYEIHIWLVDLQNQNIWKIPDEAFETA